MAGLTRREVLGGAAAAAVGGMVMPAWAESSDPPFGLGTVTYNVPKDWDLATLLRILPEAGIHAIEFRTTHKHGVEPSMTAAQRADVKQRCKDAGIKQLSLGSVCEFHAVDQAVVKQHIDTCAEFVKLAQDIGALGVKVRPNGLPKDVPVDKTLEQIGIALRQCGEVAKNHGVEIWVEVHGGGTQEPVNMRKIMDHCGHKSVGINWNSNPPDVKGGSVKESFDLLKPFLMSVHINKLDSGYPYRELFALLRDAKYSRYTLNEVGTAVPPEQGLEYFKSYRQQWLELARKA
jgi:sugar phosphate isomerase/epimerase